MRLILCFLLFFLANFFLVAPFPSFINFMLFLSLSLPFFPHSSLFLPHSLLSSSSFLQIQLFINEFKFRTLNILFIVNGCEWPGLDMKKEGEWRMMIDSLEECDSIPEDVKKEKRVDESGFSQTEENERKREQIVSQK